WNTNATYNVLVTTKALVAGLNRTNVSLTIHVGEPSNLLDFSQASGCGGRGTTFSRAVLIPWTQGSEFYFQPSQNIYGSTVLHRILYCEDYVKHPSKRNRESCIRYLLTTYNDGPALAVRCSPTMEKCSLCMGMSLDMLADEPQDPQGNPCKDSHFVLVRHREDHKRRLSISYQAISDAIVQQRSRMVNEHLAYVDRIRRYLNLFRENCSYCFIVTGELVPHKFVEACTGITDKESYHDWKYSLQFQSSTHGWTCYKCQVPFLSDDLHVSVQNRPQGWTCEWEHIIGGVAWALIKNGPLRSKFEVAWHARPGLFSDERFGVDV
ncbi:hypothetical protein FISHEDRAFT_59783, partial [Fistulina hepatica ATCC 64428]